MQQQISGAFSTRRAAELAVEHLVQEHKIDRKLVTVRPRGPENSAGQTKAGADAESGHPGVAKDGDPELNGAIAVSVACGSDQAEVVTAALRQAGATEIDGG
jgi:hypothetical protein